jgi:predicted AlkP superfamily phosphohydrolase/phosphomutase
VTKFLIFGLDGATFDLIEPWAAAGKLPNLARLLARSASGRMASTIPPMTFPAWNTFMTGKNPGKHGIFDFTQREGLEIQIVNARHRREKTVWQILSDAGKRVAVVGVPVCYPPDPINGVMISGFDAPMAVADEKSIHPPELCETLRKEIGGYIISADIVPLLNQGKIEEATQALEGSVARKGAAAKYLLTREDWDCLMITWGETDACVHYCWRYHDPASPHHDTVRCAGIRDPLLAVYQKVDQQIGEILSQVGPETTVLLVSDHGTGGASDKVVHLNLWLEQNGFLGHLASTGLVSGKLLHQAKAWVRAVLPKGIINRIRFGKKGLAYKLESKLRFGAIDWPKTHAFSEETPYYPQIWLNLKGRDPHGTVSSGAEADALCKRLIQKLLEWKDPETGEKVVSHVYRREEVYQGAYVGKSPDLLIQWNLDRGYAYLFRPSSASAARMPIEKVSAKELWSSNFMLNRSGCHRDDGIFSIAGGGVSPKTPVKEARIADVVPTLLYAMGLPVDSGMDGRVMTEAFQPDVIKARPVVYATNGTGPTVASSDTTYSDEETAKITERLQGLGYLE